MILAPANATKVQHLESSWLLINDRHNWFWPLLHHYWKCGLIGDEMLEHPPRNTVAEELIKVAQDPRTDPACRAQIELLAQRPDAREMKIWQQ